MEEVSHANRPGEFRGRPLLTDAGWIHKISGPVQLKLLEITNTHEVTKISLNCFKASSTMSDLQSNGWLYSDDGVALELLSDWPTRALATAVTHCRPMGNI